MSTELSFDAEEKIVKNNEKKLILTRDTLQKNAKRFQRPTIYIIYWLNLTFYLQWKINLVNIVLRNVVVVVRTRRKTREKYGRFYV